MTAVAQASLAAWATSKKRTSLIHLPGHYLRESHWAKPDAASSNPQLIFFGCGRRLRFESRPTAFAALHGGHLVEGGGRAGRRQTARVRSRETPISCRKAVRSTAEVARRIRPAATRLARWQFCRLNRRPPSGLRPR